MQGETLDQVIIISQPNNVPKFTKQFSFVDC